jgi:hypothetical protein
MALQAFQRWRRRKLTMAKVRSFLRSTPSRLGRRIAQFVTIAAASLPEVGA